MPEEYHINPEWLLLGGKPMFIPAIADPDAFTKTHAGPPPEGHVDTDEADGLPEDQSPKHDATDPGQAEEDDDEGA